MKNVLVGALSLLLLALAPAAWANGNSRAAHGTDRPAAFEGLRISNNQWPDSSTLRSFAEDAIRLERARTEEEEALALYKWIARVMTIGGSAHEGPPGHETYVLDTLKILNVYGNHWCDGQARLYETMWRALGRQSARLYIPMRHHTFVELWWRDTDGQGRWHALDVNNGWFVRNARGWIASSEEIERNPLLVVSANQNLMMRTKGWLRTHQTPAPTHSMDLRIRRGERYALRWDNEGIYYVNPRTRASVSPDNPLYQSGGQYARFIGGGQMEFTPDLTDPAWTRDLREEPTNVAVAAGRLAPHVVGQPASFTYEFDFPYVIADAFVEASVAGADPRASQQISFSVDQGKTWQTAWQRDASGPARLAVNLGTERERAGRSSVRGFYTYLLRFDSSAPADAEPVTFGDLKFTHRTMMNKMTLPNLQAGWNRFTVAARATIPGHALRVVLEWSDKDGLQRAERTSARLPFAVDVFANGSGGAAVQMRAVRLEAVQWAGDRGQSAEGSLEQLRSGTAVERTEAMIQVGLSGERQAVAPLIEILRDDDPELRYWAADALGKIGDTRAVPGLIVALRDPFEAVRMSAAVALGDLKAKGAVPALGELVVGKIPSAKGYALFNPVDVGAARWMAARALGRIGDPLAVAPLTEALLQDDGDLGLFVAQALAQLGDRRAVPALLKAAERRSEPALRGTIEAFGLLGDARAIPLLLDLLTSGNEDARHTAAVALGQLRGQAAAAALKKAALDDPAQHVRESAAAALEEIRRREQR